MTQTAAAATFGVSVQAVNTWMAVDKTGGLRAWAAKQRGRLVGTGRLSTAQASKIRQQIFDKMPIQSKLKNARGGRRAHWINRDQLVFRVFHGTFRTLIFVDFMRRLRLQNTGKVYLIAAGHPKHRSELAKAVAAANPTDFRLIQLPGNCPELNPDELLNQVVKTNAHRKSRPCTCDEMTASVRRHLFRRQKQPQVIENLFQE